VRETLREKGILEKRDTYSRQTFAHPTPTFSINILPPYTYMPEACLRQSYPKVSYSVLQCVALCCSVLHCVTVCCSVLHCVAVCCSVLQCVAVCCSVLQCVAVCCSVLQCVAVCYSVLQYVTACCSVSMRCNSLQLTASHCDTLQHTAPQHLHTPTHLRRPYTKKPPQYSARDFA